MCVDVCFWTFSSTFNIISVSKLVERLEHLDYQVTNWLSSYLTNRVQYTKSGPNQSKTVITNIGTPQGTVLSPLLFSIYTDIIRSETTNVTILKYADDTVLIGNIGKVDDFVAYCNEVDRVHNLCSENDLLLNASKTKEMIFTTKNNFSIKIFGRCISNDLKIMRN